MTYKHSKQCQTCSKEFFKRYNEGATEWTGHRFCSLACRPTIWNKGLTKDDERVASYLAKTSATRFKSEDTTGSKNVKWKGTEASYAAKHMWARYHFGTPKLCEHCGVTDRKMYHWANISKTYIRDRSDWLRLCVPCHKKFDLDRLT